MRVLMACAEFSPLARTGGLGDAVAGLAAALVRRGHRVTVAMPRYAHLQEEGEPGEAAPGPAVGTMRLERAGVEVLLVDDPPAFDRPGIYGATPGTGYEDSWWRWGRFALAVSDLATDYEVVHLHDAHVGAVALVSPAPAVFTVHNPAHPVLGPLGEAADLLALGGEVVAPGGALEWYGEANYLKAGIVASARSSTVSPTFAVELGAPNEESFGLGDVIRSLPVPMTGILNGIDAGAWDPTEDPWLPSPFSAADRSGRAAVRAALLERAGLDDGVLFGNVGRVSEQKGFTLLDSIVDDLVAEGFRMVMVGNGDLDPLYDGWVARHPTAMAHFEFGDELARLTFGGCDAYLMPSRFEPSGLGQLYAMQYGCPPVVRFTGGLADSVVDVDEDPRTGTGLGFYPYEPRELAKTVRRAMRYHRALPDLWADMAERGMTTDWSWDRRADEYAALYAEAAG